MILNAAGPWCRDFAKRFDRDEPSLFRSMMAWNVLFNHPAISEHAVAVSPPGPSAHTYFIVPWKGMVFAGTGHAPWNSNEKKPQPYKDQLDSFCSQLNLALPGINLCINRILHVFAGLQSAKVEGGTKFSKREVIVDHAEKGGPENFFSVSGIKFTTARKVAEKVINRLYPKSSATPSSIHRQCPPPADANTAVGVYPFNWTPDQEDKAWGAKMRTIAEQEAVVHLDDLVVRRTSLGDNPHRAMAAAKYLCLVMEWDEQRSKAEMDRLRDHFQWINEIPSS
jgi:glycerol-3-phosphate dehydrogenase